MISPHRLPIAKKPGIVRATADRTCATQSTKNASLLIDAVNAGRARHLTGAIVSTKTSVHVRTVMAIYTKAILGGRIL